jgi:hypothetical protein
VGSPNYPTTAAGVNDDLVAVVNGVHLYVMEGATGDMLYSRNLKGVPGAGPALSRTYAFVPTIDGAMESYFLEDPQEPPGHYQAAGRSLVQPVTTPDTVVWPTDRGYYYVAPANRVGIYYRLETAGSAIAKPAYAAGKLYMVSLNGYVYCLEEMLGRLQWSRAFNEPISRQPLVVGKDLFVRGDYGGLWCLDAATGNTKWDRVGVEQVLGVAGGKVYVATARMTGLMALDIETGESSGQTQLNGGIHLVPLTNTMTDRIYLADDSGFIQCFRPLGGGEPVTHIDVAETDPPVEVAQPKAPAEPAAKDPAAGGNPFGGGGANPFGGGGGANPFGGGAGGDNPFGGGAGAGGGNPFGGGAGAGGAGDNPFGGGGGGAGAGGAGGNPFGGGAGAGGAGDNPFGGGGMSGDNPFGGN